MPMGYLARRVAAVLTATFVFITSTNCVCQGSFVRVDANVCHDEDSSVEKSCCRHKHHEEETESQPCHHDGSGNHDPACDHCKGTLLAANESTTQNLSASLSVSFFVPFTHVGIHAASIVTPTFAHCYGDLPPPVGPPTLLSLGCSFTT